MQTRIRITYSQKRSPLVKIKKIFFCALLVTTILISPLFQATASGYDTHDNRPAITQLSNAQRSVTPQMQEAANRLNSIDLFRGRGTNSDGTPIYSLEDGLTRPEGATLLVRLMGVESIVQSGTWTHPFTDVQNHWATKEIGYCYANGIITGISSTEFGTDNLTMQHWATLVLRAMGYRDVAIGGSDFSYGEVLQDIARLNVAPLTVVYAGSSNLIRGDAVLVADSMMSANTKSGVQFIQTLIDSGAVSQSAASQAGYLGNTVVTPPTTNPSERTPTQPYYAEYQSTVTNPANGYTGWYRDQGGFDIPLEQSVYLENGVIMNDPRVINRDRTYGTGSGNAHQVVELLNYVIGIMNSLDNNIQYTSDGSIVENTGGMWKTIEHYRSIYNNQRNYGKWTSFTFEEYLEIAMYIDNGRVELPASERNLAIVQSCSANGAKYVTTTGAGNAYNAYNAINPDWTRGTTCAIWAAYSQVFLDILGVPNRYVVSRAGDHAWVAVEVDGVWYHNASPDYMVTNPTSRRQVFSDWAWQD